MMRCALLISLALLAGCDEHCPDLPGGGQVCLQAPAAIPAFNALQQVVITSPDRRETMLMQIENTPQQLALGALTPLGQTLFTMRWDGSRAQASWAPGITPPFDASLLIGLIQMAQSPTLPQVDGVAIRREGSRPPYDRISIELPAARLRLDIQNLPQENAQ